METLIPDFWILVDAEETTTVSLGDHSINVIEGVSFYIGVEPEYNHTDPASYPSGHPLAPQVHTMHWGWASGYRFLAIEGDGGFDFNQVFELHGLGDNNYFKIDIPLSAVAENNEVTINLDADYNRILENMPLSDGIVVHGEIAEAQQSLENMRDFVFGPANSTTPTINFNEIRAIKLFPNPTTTISTINIQSTENALYEVMVTNILGQTVQVHQSINSNTDLHLKLENPGLYLVRILKEGQLVTTKKLMVN